MLGRVSGRELWGAIERALPDESERQVIYCSFALDMKPGEMGPGMMGPQSGR